MRSGEPDPAVSAGAGWDVRILDVLTDVVLRYDAGGTLLWASPSLSCLGWTPAEVVGSHFDPASPADRALALDAYTAALAGGSSSLDQRLQALHRDGTLRWVQARTSILRDTTGLITGIVAVLRDISAQVGQEAATARREGPLRRLSEAMSEVLVETDAAGHITWISAPVTPVFGWSLEEILGCAITEFIHPDDYRPDIRQAIFAGVTLEGPSGGWLVRIRTKHGEFRWTQASVTLLPDRRGTLAALRNIDELVQARTTAEQSQALLRSALDSLLDPVMLLSPVRDANATIIDFCFVDANPATCAYFSRTHDELVHSRLTDVVAPNVRMVLLHAASQVITTGVPIFWDSQPFPPILPQTLVRYYDVRAVLVGDVVSATWRDVTERHVTAKALEDSEARYRLLADTAVDVVLTTSADLVIDWVSPSAEVTLGIPARELSGQPLLSFIHPDELLVLRPASDQFTAPRVRVRFRVGDGQWRWFELAARTVTPPSGGQPIRVYGLRDIDGEVRATARLTRSEQRFRLAMHSAPIGMALVGLDRRIQEVNPAFCRMLGYSESRLQSRPMSDIVAPEDYSLDQQRHADLLDNTSSTTIREKRLIDSTGNVVWVENEIGLLRDELGVPLSYISQFVDVTDNHRSREQLQYLATHDVLTELANRHQLMTALTGMLGEPAGQEFPAALLYGDLDGMKAVNDEYGHAAGDEVLREVARRLRNGVRSHDLVARLGGDEFVVVLTQVRSDQDARKSAAALCRAVEVPIILNGNEVRVGMSIGVGLGRYGDDPERLLARADQALYRAKRQGGHQVVMGRAVTGPDEAVTGPDLPPA